MKTMRVMGLWKHKDGKGNIYLNGKLTGNVYITIRVNDFKKGEKEPDYNLYFTQPETDNKDKGLDNETL